MKEYMRPTMQGELFAANEFVAVCWGVACITDKANNYEKEYYPFLPPWIGGSNNYDLGQTHSPNQCGQIFHQWIDTGDDDIADAMYEIETSGLGNLLCTLTDSKYRGSVSIKDVGPGDYIYWTTQSGNRVWHHQGRVEYTVPGHPNRS